MAINPDRLERYSDFVDPERIGLPYDPRKGLERLIGVLSPDTKGVVLAAMGEDWYGTERQLTTRVFSWLNELGISPKAWPLSHNAAWNYCQARNSSNEIIDGSLVSLGAVVKIAESPAQILYFRSLAGEELAVPLVHQAAKFVTKAREYAEAQKLKGIKPPKFDSMWRIMGPLNSATDQRGPLAAWDVIDFLVHNPGQHRKEDLHDQLHLPYNRLQRVLDALGNCGIIDYLSPQKEKGGRRGQGWVVYRRAKDFSARYIDPERVYQSIKNIRKRFTMRTVLFQILDYIDRHPDDEYESHIIGKELGIKTAWIGEVLSPLSDEGIGLLHRPDPSFRGKSRASVASANELTHIFNDLVFAPAKTTADTLTPVSFTSWSKQEIAVYLQNYAEERTHKGPQEAVEVRDLVADILSQNGADMKLGQIADIYNQDAERELTSHGVRSALTRLIKAGAVEQPKPGYYRSTQSQKK